MADSNDPAAEDVGNILSLEHVNLTVPDQSLATLFYIVGLGFTRDPYLNVGLQNMWVNVGEQQFHLPTRPAQVIPGRIGLVVPSLDALQERLAAIEPRLAGTHFAWRRDDARIDATCPWGNQFQCHPPDPAVGDVPLGIAYVEFLTPPGAASGIAAFYRDVMGAPAQFDPAHRSARVAIGSRQTLRFRETEEDLPAYVGHHIAVYLTDFSRPYRFMQEHELVREAMSNHQFRFQDLVDPASGAVVFSLEHEVRSFRHPMYRRPLVNRDPEQTQRSYQRGHDALVI